VPRSTSKSVLKLARKCSWSRPIGSELWKKWKASNSPW
jgi:hypothetical protein